jgi:hypothetical protein
MKLRNVLTVLGTAVVTAALTLALLAPWGGSVQAGPAVHPTIAQPQLTSQGCAFTLKTDKATYEAGQSPAVEVTAVNPTDKPVSASVWVTVTSTTPTSRMSRMLPMPLTLWSHEYTFTLASDERKSLSAECKAMPAGGNVAITMTDQNNGILAGVYGVPAQNQQQAVNNQAAIQAAINAIAAQGGPNGKQPNNVPQAAPQQ